MAIATGACAKLLAVALQKNLGHEIRSDQFGFGAKVGVNHTVKNPHGFGPISAKTGLKSELTPGVINTSNP